MEWFLYDLFAAFYREAGEISNPKRRNCAADKDFPTPQVSN
jgi:hypothetical protein